MRAAVVILLAMGWSARSLAADAVAVVVLPLEGQDVERKVADGVAAIIEDEVSALDGFRVLPVNARVRALLKKCKAADAVCLARAADARGADLALSGSVRRLEGALELHLRLLDVARQRARREALEPLGDGEQGLRRGVHRAVLGALAPERLTGSVQVTCNVDGARVRVDGRSVGTTPLAQPIEGVAEGRRSVQVDRVGYEPFEQVVEVRYREESLVQAALLRRTDISAEQVQELEQAEVPPGPWRPGLGPWSWVLAGGGGALLLGGVASGVLALLQAAEVERRAAGQVLVFPRDQALVEQGRLYAVLANLLYGLGAVALGSGVGLGVWDLLVPGPAAPLAPPPPAPAPGAEVEEWDADLTPPPEARPAPAPPAVDEAAADDGTPADDRASDALPDGDALPEGDL